MTMFNARFGATSGAMCTATFHAPPTLASTMDAAINAAAAAHRWQARLCMIDTTRLVRSIFPAAAALVIDVEQRHVWPEGVQVVGVLHHTGGVLWSDSLDHVRDYRTAEGHRWRAVHERLEGHLTAALGTAEPDRVWTSANHLAPALGREGMFAPELFRAPLPAEDEIDELLRVSSIQTVETRRRARHYNRRARLLRTTSDTDLSAIRVAGALVFTGVDPHRARPTLRVSVDLDEVVPELRSLPDQAVAVEVSIQGVPVFTTPVDQHLEPE